MGMLAFKASSRPNKDTTHWTQIASEPIVCTSPDLHLSRVVEFLLQSGDFGRHISDPLPLCLTEPVVCLHLTPHALYILGEDVHKAMAHGELPGRDVEAGVEVSRDSFAGRAVLELIRSRADSCGFIFEIPTFSFQCGYPFRQSCHLSPQRSFRAIDATTRLLAGDAVELILKDNQMLANVGLTMVPNRFGVDDLITAKWAEFPRSGAVACSQVDMSRHVPSQNVTPAAALAGELDFRTAITAAGVGGLRCEQSPVYWTVHVKTLIHGYSRRIIMGGNTQSSHEKIHRKYFYQYQYVWLTLHSPLKNGRNLPFYIRQAAPRSHSASPAIRTWGPYDAVDSLEFTVESESESPGQNQKKMRVL